MRARVDIGDCGYRAVIALYLTPESADDLADVLHSDDRGGRELREAAERARALLGESERRKFDEGLRNIVRGLTVDGSKPWVRP